MTLLTISCFGSFQASLDGQPITSFGTDKVRALLVYLAVEAGQPHRRERLAGLLWSDQAEGRALHNLRQALSTLRKALSTPPDSAPFLFVTSETVQFNPSSEYWLDVKAFNTCLEESLRHFQRRSTRGRLHIRRLRQGVALYRGHFLDGFSLAGSPLYDEWATLQREALHHRTVEALTLLAEYHERRGEYALARQTASRLVDLAPWDETARIQFMRLLALDGQWSAAQAQYQALRRYLDEEMGLKPASETTALYEHIRNWAIRDTPLAPRYPPARHNLPVSPTPFIGREAELDDLATMLADPQCRLLTLIGPGGVGKTRLALEAAREQVGTFADGVFFVPLASVSTGDLVVPALAEALGLMLSDRETPRNQLLDYLRAKNLLLVLDNFEQLLTSESGGVMLGDILQTAPGVVLLVTSRERLNLREECLYALSGLNYPVEAETQRGGPERGAETYSAVALFCDTARRLQRAFSPSPLDIAAIVRICQLLEGLPLGVELAASAAAHQTCQEIVLSLGHGLDGLSVTTVNLPARHRSLRAAFDVSWALLDPVEQGALSRLSVFRGGFEPEAAQQVAQASPHTLSALLDQSLLRRAPAGRFEINETIRQFAADRLAAAPQTEMDALARHARYYAGYLARLNSKLKGAGQKLALDALRSETENVRRAWHWLVDRGGPALSELAACVDTLYRFYDSQSRFDEGVELLQAAAARLADVPGAESTLARVLSRLASLAERIGKYDVARASASRSREILEAWPDEAELAFCLVAQGTLTHRSGAYAEARRWIETGLAHYQALSDRYGEAGALHSLGVVNYRLGNIAEAKCCLEDSLALGRAIGNPRRLVAALNVLADVLCHLGEYTRAKELFHESLTISQELGDQYHVGILLTNLGTVDQVLGDFSVAEAGYRQSLEICHEIGDRVGEAMALVNLGELAALRGNCAESRRFARQSLEMGRALQDHWIVVASLNALAEAAHAEGDCAGAWPYLAEAARLEMETQTLQMLARTTVNAGGVLLQQGHTGLALEVMAAALAHPACQDDVRQKAEKWLKEARLETPARPSLSLEAAIAAALERR